MINIILETERIILRTFTLQDLASLHELHSHANVMKYLIGGTRAKLSDTEMDLQKYLEHQEKYRFGKWAMIHKLSGEFMGRAGLVTIPDSKEIDLGYALHKKFWGQGYATEIAQALVEYANINLKGHTLVGLVKEGNQASVNILQKIGFIFTVCGLYFGEEFLVYKGNA